MIRRLNVRPAAKRDLREAAKWYEKQRAGLGEQLLEAAGDCFAAVGPHPAAYQLVYKSIRHARFARFPYAAFFAIEGDVIQVVGVFHGSRDPRVWQRRADNL